MKEIEKILHEAVKQYSDLMCSNPYIHGDLSLPLGSYSKGFSEGFRKARGMAAKLMGNKYPHPNFVGLQAPLLIHEIGESEVKE